MTSTSSDTISIPLSKFNIALLTVASFTLVAFAFWIMRFARGSYREPFVWGVAIVILVLFGACGLFGLLKWFDKKPGLTLDADGIIDNSSGVAQGRISWSDIYDMRITTVRNQRFLTVFVYSAEKYLTSGNFIKRRISAANHRLYGSPIQISSQSLQISFDDMIEIVDRFYERFGQT